MGNNFAASIQVGSLKSSQSLKLYLQNDLLGQCLNIKGRTPELTEWGSTLLKQNKRTHMRVLTGVSRFNIVLLGSSRINARHLEVRLCDRRAEEQVYNFSTVKSRYKVPPYNVFPRYNVENFFLFLIGLHVNRPRYNVTFHVTLKNCGPQSNVISRFHCITSELRYHGWRNRLGKVTPRRKLLDCRSYQVSRIAASQRSRRTSTMPLLQTVMPLLALYTMYTYPFPGKGHGPSYIGEKGPHQLCLSFSL